MKLNFWFKAIRCWIKWIQLQEQRFILHHAKISWRAQHSHKTMKIWMICTHAFVQLNMYLVLLPVEGGSMGASLSFVLRALVDLVALSLAPGEASFLWTKTGRWEFLYANCLLCCTRWFKLLTVVQILQCTVWNVCSKSFGLLWCIWSYLSWTQRSGNCGLFGSVRFL